MESIKHFLQITLTFAAFILDAVKTPAKFIGRTLLRILTWYKALWVKCTHNKYEEFVYKRGATMAAATIATIIIIPTILSLILQTSYYLATYKKERVYLSQSEEIYPDDNIWAVRGCDTKNCDSDTSRYYRIRPSLFHHMWNIGHTGNLFLPDIIGASVPTGSTQCEVISYGVRTRFMMALHIYPNILKVTCGGDETPAP